MADIAAVSSVRGSALLRTLGMATTIQIVATASVLALTAIAPTVAASLGVGSHWIGYQISIIYVAGMASSAVAGSLLERLGPIRLQQLLLACLGVGFLGMATGQIALIALASLSIGFGYGLNNPASSDLLTRVTPVARRNMVFSVKQTGVPLGGVLASFAFPLVGALYGWQVALLFGAACPVILALALLLAAQPAGTLERSGSWLANMAAQQSTIWRSTNLATLSFIGLAYSAMQLSIQAFAVVALVHDSGWSLIAAGSVAAAMQIAGAFGRIIWGIAADRIGGGFAALAWLGLLGGVGHVLMFWLSDLPQTLQAALIIAVGFVTIGWNGVFFAQLTRNAPAGRVGAFTGGALVYTFLGVIIGPSCFALLFTLSGTYGPSFLVFAAFGFAGAAAAWRAHRMQGVEGQA